VVVNAAGGTGGGLGTNDTATPAQNNGGLGRFLWGSNTATVLAGVASVGQTETFSGPTDANPFLDGAQSPTIPNLVGGAEAYGLTGLNSQQILLPSVFADAPTGAQVAVIRSHRGPAGFNYDFSGYDMLLYVNLTGQPIENPALSVGNDKALQQLEVGGYLLNPLLGGTGLQTLSQLGAYQVYATLVPAGTDVVNAGWQQGSGQVACSVTIQNNQRLYLGGSQALSPLATVNQSEPPSGKTPVETWNTGDGRLWKDLGTVAVSNGTLTVSASPTANGPVAADAVRLVRVSSLTSPQPVMPLAVLSNVVLTGNPLGNGSYGPAGTIAQLKAAGVSVTYNDDASPPTFPTVGPQGTAENTADTIELSATDGGGPVFYTASSSNANVACTVQGSQLTLTPSGNFTGVAEIMVTAWDGPSGERDWCGRSTSQTFDLSVGTAAVYGQVTEDSAENSSTPGLAGITVNFQNSTTNQTVASTTTDPNGNYSLLSLPAGIKGYVVEQKPANWSLANETNGSGSITTSAGQVTVGDNFTDWLVAAAVINQTVNEGQAVTLTTTLHSRGADNLSASWTATYNSQVVASGTGSSFTFTPQHWGSYAVNLVVTDTTGPDAGSYVLAATVTANDVPPTLTVPSSPLQYSEGQTVNLTAQNGSQGGSPVYFVNAGTLDTDTYLWQVASSNGQTVPNSTAQTLSFTPLHAGTYTVTLTVTNDGGLPAQKSFTVTALDVPPTVSAGGPYMITEGGSVTLYGSATCVGGPSDLGAFTWAFNNGLYGDATESSPTVTWAQLYALGITQAPQTIPISLKVFDIHGNYTIASTTLTINLAAPTNVSAGGPYTIDVGGSLALSASAVDPSLNTGQLIYTWKIDGSSQFSGANSASPTLSWAQLTSIPGVAQGPGIYSMTVTVTDDNGAGLSTTSVPVALTILNLPPVNVSAGGPYTINDGSPVTLSATASDLSGNNSQLSYVWTVNGDALASTSSPNLTLNWAQLNALAITMGPQICLVSVTVTNAGGLSTTSAPTTLTVNDLPPTNVSAGGPYTITEGSPLTLSATAGDPSGDNSQLLYSWDVNGDSVFGQATGQDPTLTWAQLNALGITVGGTTWQVSVQVTNLGGDSTISESVPLTIESVAPSSVSAGGPYNVYPGQSLSLSATSTMPAGVNDPVNYLWSVNGGGLYGSVTGQDRTLGWSQLVGLGLGSGATSFDVAVQAVNSLSGQATTSAPAVLTVAYSPPTVATPASASSSSISGTTVNLSVLGADAGGQSNLTYTWATTGTPPGPVSFSANATNAAQNTTATFTAAGSYAFQVTITDAGGLSTTSSVNVTVEQALTSITVSPASASLNAAATAQFTATGYDQFGTALSVQPTFAWGTSAGSISTAGLLTASNTSGVATVTASSGAVNGTATVTVTNHTPTVAKAAAATPNPVTGTTASLSVLGADVDTGEASLIYTWVTTISPNGATSPVFSINGTNAAKNTTATLSEAGTYAFTVIIFDPGGLLTTSTTLVTVNQAVSSIVVAQSSASLNVNGTEQFSATAFDQFGTLMASQPTFAWSASGGTVNSSGQFSPAYAAGTAALQATAGTVSGSLSVPLPGTAQWTGTSDTSWNAASTWIGAGSVGPLASPGLRGVTGDTVLLAPVTAHTIRLDGSSPSIAGITMDGSGGTPTLAAGSGGTLYLNNGGQSATVSIVAGTGVISEPLAANSNIVVSPATGSTLNIVGGISGAGQSLTVNNSGTLVLGGDNGYTGGTIVTAGTLIVSTATALPNGTSLTVGAGGTFIFDPSTAASNATAAASAAQSANSANTTLSATPLATAAISPAVTTTSTSGDSSLATNEVAALGSPSVSSDTTTGSACPVVAEVARSNGAVADSSVGTATTPLFRQNPQITAVAGYIMPTSAGQNLVNDRPSIATKIPVVPRSMTPARLAAPASNAGNGASDAARILSVPATAPTNAVVPTHATAIDAALQQNASRAAALADLSWLMPASWGQTQKDRSKSGDSPRIAADLLFASYGQ
jgi:autotransporter-associated beta strand protein